MARIKRTVLLMLTGLAAAASAHGTHERPAVWPQYDHRSPREAPYAVRHVRHEQAHRYAAVAVRQATEARHLGHHSDHPRWSLDYRGHFHWALHEAPHRLEKEIRKRAKKLRKLRYRSGRHLHGGHPYR